MKTKNLLLLFLLLIPFYINAQSHKVGQANYNCKLNKKGWFFNSEALSCPACEANDKKEQTAKLAEDKRRNDVVIVKAKADKIASDLAYKKNQAEIAEKNKVTEVKLVMPKSKVIANKISNEKTKSNEMKNNYFHTEKSQVSNQNIVGVYYGARDSSETPEKYFIINGEKIFTNNEYKVCIGNYTYPITFEGLEINLNFPPNVGIVVLNEEFTDQFGKKIHISDLVNIKGERVFNDNTISTIIHFADDYFIIFRGEPQTRWGYNGVKFSESAGDAFIYKLKTKEKYIIPHITTSNGKKIGYDVDANVNVRSTAKDIDFNKYKARFRSEIKSYPQEFIYYYITQEGKLEKEIK